MLLTGPQCFESAKAVILTLIDSLIPTGYMRTSPDGHFVFASFASAFLLKVGVWELGAVVRQ